MKPTGVSCRKPRELPLFISDLHLTTDLTINALAHCSTIHELLINDVDF